MSDINQPFFSEEDDFNPFAPNEFATKVLDHYKQTVETQGEIVAIEDVLMIVCGLYIEMRECTDPEFLMQTISSALYITEQVIQKNAKNYPGRYPNTKAEAELKFEIEKMFQDFNLDE
tara:strand:- start:865 stop:1218 length:354 start_codon:yes stop_codon:yes gene_type:complete